MKAKNNPERPKDPKDHTTKPTIDTRLTMPEYLYFPAEASEITSVKTPTAAAVMKFAKMKNARTPATFGWPTAIIANAQGEFSYGIPKAGWWGFCALGVGPATEFKGKELSQDAVIWIQAGEMK